MKSDQISDNIILEEEVSLKELIIKIREWIAFFLSKWVVILMFILIGAVLGLVYSYFNKPIYIATTTFVLEEGDKTGGLSGNLSGLASMAGIDIGGGGGIFQGDNILHLYKSRTMIEKTLFTKMNGSDGDKLLIEQYIGFNKLKDKWSRSESLKNIQFTEKNVNGGGFNRLQDSIIGVIVDDISNNYLSVIKQDKKLSIIQANVRSKNEMFSKLFNEAIVKNVSDFYVQTKTKKATDNVNILQHKVDSLNQVMNKSIYSSVAITDATPNLNLTKQIKRLAPVQKAQFSAEVNKVALSSLVQNLELAKISLLKETPLIKVIDGPVFPLKKEKVGKTKGVVFGGTLFGFLIMFFLTIKQVYRKVMGNN